MLAGGWVVYLGAWTAACVAAIVLAVVAARRGRLAIARAAYWRGLVRPWKLVTFAVACAGMVLVAPRTGDPTWDAVDGGFMSVLAFTTAPWALGVVVRALVPALRVRDPLELYVAGCVWLFSASWSYDGWLLWRDGAYPPTWWTNLFASSGLYAAAGAMWSLAWREGRGLTFAFLEPDWLDALSASSFRRVGVLAVGLMVLVLAMLSPFLWIAIRS